MDIKQFLLTSNYIQNVNSGVVMPINESSKPFGDGVANKQKPLYNKSKQNEVIDDSRMTQSNVANLGRFA
jgi:hypothetical protein